MRHAALLLLAVCGCTPSAPAPSADRPAPESTVAAQEALDGDALVVHEWGTFTSMAGSDGVELDGLHHAADPLPRFVHRLGPAAEPSPFHAYGDLSSYVPARHVTGKMETPVVYFYSKRAQRVSLHVDFPNGVLTEWYPGVSAVVPAAADVAQGPLDVAKIERSSLDWDVDLTPFAGGAPRGLPEVAADDPWAFAREVKAAYVTPHGAAEPEHYLFYRGLGRINLPLQLRYCHDETLKLRSASASPIPAAFALQMTPSGGRFTSLGAVESSAAITFPEALSPKDQVVSSIGRAMEQALVAAGLYADEARAMVRTWSPGWFASEGTRVLYLLRRDAADAVLPLRITPAPAKLVRVLVVRQEILTPADEDAIEKALADRASPTDRAGADQRLAHYGRFLEPGVRRAVEFSEDPAVKKSGREVLASFH